MNALIKKENNQIRKEVLASEEMISDINIQEAVVHILDKNINEPLLNEFTIDLTEDTYKYIYKHIEKCLKSDNLKFAIYNDERNIIKESCVDYFNDESKNIVDLSKDIARQLFAIMIGNEDISSGDLIVSRIVTDKGPFICILKMDYVKNFTHQVNFKDDKMGIELIPHSAGLPACSQKIQKAAFIRPFNSKNSYDLFVIDEMSKRRSEDEYGANYFTNNFLGCSIIDSNKDYTKRFANAVEVWTRTNVTEDAGRAEEIRCAVTKILKDEDSIDVKEISSALFVNENENKNDFENFLEKNDIPNEFVVDKPYISKKVSKKKIKVDKDIEVSISIDSYEDKSKFEIIKNGDGTINMVIKNVINYIEK